MIRALLGPLALLLLLAGPAAADGFRILDGHGGPVHAAAFGDGIAVTGGFDNAVALWDGAAGAPRWLDGHEAAVKSVALLGEDRVVSGGDDQRVLVWDRATGALLHRLDGHQGAVSAVAASPDGRLIASAAWDRRIGLWDGETGAHLRWLEGHAGNVSDVAFGPGGHLYSAAHDGTIDEWRVADGTLTRALVRHGFGVNALVVSGRGDWLAYGSLDGGTRVIRLSDGAELADLTLDRRPVLAMAMRHDGRQIAVGDGQGFIMVVDTGDWAITRDFRAAKRGPIWALAYVDDGRALLAGGLEDDAYVFPLIDEGDLRQMSVEKRAFHVDPSTVGNGERQFLRKCAVCHSLTPDGGRRAGPTLYGLFGRTAGTVVGYRYSAALQKADLVWSDETVDRLFDLGPDVYTPGSKMPVQRITAEKDRADLIAYLREKTAR